MEKWQGGSLESIQIKTTHIQTDPITDPMTDESESVDSVSSMGLVGLRAEIRARWKEAREASSHLPKNNGCRGC
jgi:hypothetical protein